MFRCRACRRTCNERTNTPYNHLQVPTDIAVLVVLWRLQYKLSLRNVAEMFLTRGFTFTHETVRAWEERLAPLLTAQLKAKRRGKAGRKWHVDETYVKVERRWHYLYRVIDSDGNLVETMLSKTRDMDAAKRFFACALKTVGQTPEKVTTDGHDSYPRAVRETLCPDAGVRLLRLRRSLLYRPRRTPGPSSSPHPLQRGRLPRRATPPVSGALGRGVRSALGCLTTPATALPQPTAA